MTALDVYECMAYDLTQTDEWQERRKREVELEESRKLSPNDFAAQFKKQLIEINDGSSK